MKEAYIFMFDYDSLVYLRENNLIIVYEGLKLELEMLFQSCIFLIE